MAVVGVVLVASLGDAQPARLPPPVTVRGPGPSPAVEGGEGLVVVPPPLVDFTSSLETPATTVPQTTHPTTDEIPDEDGIDPPDGEGPSESPDEGDSADSPDEESPSGSPDEEGSADSPDD